MSSSLLSFGRVRFEGRGGQVGVEGPLPAECFVGRTRLYSSVKGRFPPLTGQVVKAGWLPAV